jgi:RimJ/RimL family protein N-acetyltransferase
LPSETTKTAASFRAARADLAPARYGRVVATLETERLLLERWNERHRESWQLICRDPEVMRFIGPGQLREPAKADEVCDGMLAHWRERGFGWRSVLDRATGEWLGFVGLNVVGQGVDGVAPDEVEIGWWLVRSAWGRGYASEGAAVLRDEGFERVGLDRMIARLQPANRASSRIAEKIGMHLGREGTGRHGEALLVFRLDRAAWERQLQSEE